MLTPTSLGKTIRANFVGVVFLGTVEAVKPAIPDIRVAKVTSYWFCISGSGWFQKPLVLLALEDHINIHPIVLDNALEELQDRLERLTKVSHGLR